MSENTKKVITVLGASGRQGGSVTRALLADGSYHVRAITRDQSKPAAQALALLGAEIVEADMRNRASIDRAFAGAYGVFAVTDYWSQGVTEWGQTDETDIGILLANAAHGAGVKHYVWSTLPSPLLRSGGKYDRVEHWETKALVTAYIVQQLPRLRTTFVCFGAYYDMLGVVLPSFFDNSSSTVSLPLPANFKIPMVWTQRDAGPIVQRIFSRPDETVGHTYGVFRLTSSGDIVDALGKALAGRTVRYAETPKEQFLSAFGGGLVGHDLLGNLQYFAEYQGFKGEEEVAGGDGRLLGHRLATVGEWAMETLQNQTERPWVD